MKTKGMWKAKNIQIRTETAKGRRNTKEALAEKGGGRAEQVDVPSLDEKS